MLSSSSSNRRDRRNSRRSRPVAEMRFIDRWGWARHSEAATVEWRAEATEKGDKRRRIGGEKVNSTGRLRSSSRAL